jgi:SAM-dependent methyltransferase
MTTTTQEQGDFLREFFKRWPRFYYFAMLVFGPVFFVNLSAKKFLKKYPKEGTTLNVGSGPRVLAEGVINVDITPYDHVEVVADAGALPFESGTVSRIVSDNVLEHVELGEEAVAEAARVMMPGGYLYVSTPFMYPFHSSPHDYTRWTMLGLRRLLERNGFDIVESGVCAGPFSVLVLWKAYFAASLLCFGNTRAYTLILNIMLVLLFPIKFLDILFAHLPFAENMTSVFYIVGRKMR